MKTIISTAVVASILLALLLVMKGENEALNGKIMKLHGLEGNAIEVVNHDASSGNQFMQ
jgi:hypothetical protein